MIYTSGSTGRPKGVAIAHRHTVAMLQWAKMQFSPDELAGVLASTSICFDLSIFELFVPLSWGGCIILAENALALPQLPAAERVTLVNTVPSAMTELVNFNSLPPSVQTINLAGEAFPPSLAQKLQQLPHIQHVYNLYGPSEDTTYSTWADVSHLDTTTTHRVPIGKPITNTQAYVCDRHGNPVPIGVPGELYLSGAGIARGYLNRAELTAERFLPNSKFKIQNSKPSAHHPLPTTVYKTGDRVRYLPNGSLEFLGRFDHQVKIRGFRIETGEIEAVLSQHPTVKEAIVVAWEEAGDVQLVAYLVKAEGRRQKAEEVAKNEEQRTKKEEPTTNNQLKTYLTTKLPTYMVPNRFIELEALPRLPNGKVDRRSLPRPDNIQRDESKPFVAPRTATEKTLADIWCRELTLDKVSVQDNFFELGGHSLLGMRIMAQAEQALVQSVRLKWLFQTPTIAGLAAHIEQTKTEQTNPASSNAIYRVSTSPLPHSPTLQINPAARHEPFPLTDIQQAYLLGRSRAFELGNVATHGYREIETVGLSVAQVERALRSQIERHDMLRVVVTPEGQQRVLAEVPAYEIRVTDLRAMAPDEGQAALAAMRDRLSHQIHDVEQWPLFTIEAAQLTAERVRFFVGFDVLIGDAWSFQLLGWELAQDLQGESLPTLELTFRDYVLAEQAFRQSPSFQQAWDYWQKRVPELPPAPELPLAVSPSSIDQPQFERRSDRVTAASWQRIKQRAQQAGLTPSGVLLAAFAEVLALWSRHPRFTLNLTLFNRLPLHPDVNRIIGDFTSSLLLAVDNTGIDSFTTRARRLQSQLWEDLEHRAVSGVQVLRELARTQQRSGTALMPVVFTSTLNQNRPDAGDRPWQTEVVYGLSQTSQVYLDHQVSEINGELVFNWDAIADLFPAGMLDDMFQAYRRFLQQLADEDAAWETTPQLSPTAHVEALNETIPPLFSDSEPLLHTLFLDQAQQQPDHPAVIAGDVTLTYGELRQRVLHLAHYLQRLNVKPNQLIAVSMAKGWEPVVAVLAILTAGAAYVPIDPSLPQERRWHLIQETEATILLTQPHLADIDWPNALALINIETDPDGMYGDAKFRVSTTASIHPSTHPPIYPSTPSPQPTDLAYVIYTSGSTGTPKGVMIDHRGAVNTILDINRRFEVNAGDRVLALSALSFDLSVYDIFGTLAAGATIVMPDPAGDRDPAHWVHLLNTHSITLWNSVPALMQLFLTELASHTTHKDSLRLALLSGDWLPLPLPDQIRSHFPTAQVISLGGATEASIWSIFYPIDAIDPTWKSIPYGRPLANQQWYVLNDNLQPCPTWVPGQLYIGGTGLAKGYWQQPEKTAAAFVAWEGIGNREQGTGQRGNGELVIGNGITLLPTTHYPLPITHYPPPIYKTGDLGCYRPDGTLEFLGREDFQVKLNGYRIELGEIEVALLQHPMIQEAVVTAVGETQQSQQLVAYLVPVTGEDMADGDDAQVALNHPLAKLEFKQQWRGLRTFDEPIDSEGLAARDASLGNSQDARQAGGIALPLPKTDPQPYLRRQSYRQFLDTPIALAAFSQFLSGLKSIQLEASPLPKYRYGSAGSLYPVQTYLYVKPGRIEGVAAGFYYYHPAEHRLVPLSRSESVDTNALYGSNQTIAEQAAFAIFLIGQMDAIAPIYPEDARDFCLLEAGYMSQLLMETAPAFELGLCPLGKLGVELLQQALDLDASHQVLHGLAGGAIAPAWTQQLQPLETPRSASLTGISIADSLRQFLAQKLPTYMVPTAYQVLDALPLNANGKVDRKALPVLSSLLHREIPFVAPRTATEQAIATIWQTVLNLEDVSIHASFFEMGGNSLSAMQALSQLRQAFPIELSIRQFFTAQTLVEQAAVVDALLAEQAETAPVQSDDASIQRVTSTDADTIRPIQQDSSRNLLSQLDDLSDQDVDSLLGQLLGDDAIAVEGLEEIAAMTPAEEAQAEEPS
ncbi:MAG: amino acid adenylation domain-containing protein [Cyanobacteria bacterium J06636_16]